MERLVVIGAGGHGIVVAETAALMNVWAEITFMDDAVPAGNDVIGFKVIGKVSSHVSERWSYLVAVGTNDLRLKIAQKILTGGGHLATVIHPSAVISRSATIGNGSVVLANSVINARAVVGTAAIINTGATVDHDCVLADGVHVSPGAHLAGKVVVGESSWIGIGACVKHGCEIGERATVGAGAAVVENVEARSTVVGVPARVIRQA